MVSVFLSTWYELPPALQVGSLATFVGLATVNALAYALLADRLRATISRPAVDLGRAPQCLHDPSSVTAFAIPRVRPDRSEVIRCGSPRRASGCARFTRPSPLQDPVLDPPLERRYGPPPGRRNAIIR